MKENNQIIVVKISVLVSLHVQNLFSLKMIQTGLQSFEKFLPSNRKYLIVNIRPVTLKFSLQSIFDIFGTELEKIKDD